jgi:hypothetical protein
MHYFKIKGTYMQAKAKHHSCSKTLSLYALDRVEQIDAINIHKPNSFSKPHEINMCISIS